MYPYTLVKQFKNGWTMRKNLLMSVSMSEYGQSRSAACAAATLEYFYHDGISVFADYRYYPNQLIFNKTLTSLKKTQKTHGRK